MQLVELLRKLFLTGITVFIESGTVSQAWFATLVALAFTLLLVRYTPYIDQELDSLAFFTQICTLATLCVR